MTKNRAVKIGDAFHISTPCGSCKFQYVQRNKTFGQMISIINRDCEENDLVLCPREFEIFFPVNVASKDSLIEYLGNFKIPDVYENDLPLKYPLQTKDGNISGWMIEENGKSRKVEQLSKVEQHYSYAFAVNLAELERLFCMRWNSRMSYPD